MFNYNAAAMESYTADHMRICAKEAIVQKEKQEINLILEAIDKAAHNGNFSTCFSKKLYKTTKDRLKKLGYVIDDENDRPFTSVSWR